MKKHTESADETKRLEREKTFHNEAFSSEKRKVVDKYYSTTSRSKKLYKQLTEIGVSGKKVLEYGCGPGSQAFTLASQGASVTAIDISDIAIDLGKKEASKENLDIDFFVMNAESLDFKNDEFDKVCGSGILHHLDIEKAYSEIHRVLKKNGSAIFFEPLGHNPVINYYRNRTPDLRTEDEHPLLIKDIQLAREYFSEVKVHYFHLTSIAASFVPIAPVRGAFSNLFNGIDSLLFKLIPGLKKYAWIIVVEMKK
jgi:ubiquinone/menaquinone biosynthesis C-methylase UbiE